MQPQATQTPPKPETTEPQPKAAAATPSKPAKTGYGKRSRKQWILIYLVIAIVVYGIAYFAFFHKSGGTSGY